MFFKGFKILGWIVFGLLLTGEALIAKAVDEKAYLKALSSRRQDLEELKFIQKTAKALGVRVWLFGGSATSYAFAVRRRLEIKNPEPLQWEELVGFLRDVDLVIDGNVSQMRHLQAALEEKFPYTYRDKLIWDVVTLRTHDGRGLIDSEAFLNQHNDVFSLGLVELTAKRGSEIIRSVNEFDQPSLENNFFQSLLDEQNQFLYSERHRQTPLFKDNKNPELLSVLRFLVKSYRHGIPIAKTQKADLRRALKDFFDRSENTQLSSYVNGRVRNLVGQLLLGSADTGGGLESLFELNLIPYLFRIGGPYSDKDSLSYLLLEAIHGKLPKSLNLRDYQREKASNLNSIPTGSIMEGTIYHGGNRSYFFLDRKIPELKDAIRKAKRVAKKNMTFKEKLIEITALANELGEQDLHPGIMLRLPGYQAEFDCRDYALIVHILLSEAKIPNKIISEETVTYNHVRQGSKLWKVDAHNDSVSEADSKKGAYVLDIWTPPSKALSSTKSRVKRLMSTLLTLIQEELDQMNDIDQERFNEFHSLLLLRSEFGFEQSDKSLQQIEAYLLQVKDIESEPFNFNSDVLRQFVTNLIQNTFLQWTPSLERDALLILLANQWKTYTNLRNEETNTWLTQEILSRPDDSISNYLMHLSIQGFEEEALNNLFRELTKPGKHLHYLNQDNLLIWKKIIAAEALETFPAEVQIDWNSLGVVSLLTQYINENFPFDSVLTQSLWNFLKTQGNELKQKNWGHYQQLQDLLPSLKLDMKSLGNQTSFFKDLFNQTTSPEEFEINFLRHHFSRTHPRFITPLFLAFIQSPRWQTSASFEVLLNIPLERLSTLEIWDSLQDVDITLIKESRFHALMQALPTDQATFKLITNYFKNYIKRLTPRNFDRTLIVFQKLNELAIHSNEQEALITAWDLLNKTNLKKEHKQKIYKQWIQAFVQHGLVVKREAKEHFSQIFYENKKNQLIYRALLKEIFRQAPAATENFLLSISKNETRKQAQDLVNYLKETGAKNAIANGDLNTCKRILQDFESTQVAN